MTASEVPDDSFPLGSPPTSLDPDAILARRRELVALELHRLRQEASALRLEARAAQLQTLLHRIDAGTPLAEEEWRRWNLESDRPPPPHSQYERPGAGSPELPPEGLSDVAPDAASPDVPFGSWADLRRARGADHPPAKTDPPPVITPVSAKSPASPIADTPNANTPDLRQDPSHPSPPRPRLLGLQSPATSPAPMDEQPKKKRDDRLPVSSLKDPSDDASELDSPPEPTSPATSPASVDPFLTQLGKDEPTESGTPDSDRRRRPAAFFVSALVHVALLLILAMFGLTAHLPKDQVALSASASVNEQTTIETFQIEAAEPTQQTAASEPVETQYEINPLGTIPVVDVTSDFSDAIAPPAPELASLSSHSGSDSLRSLSSSSDAKASMEFCGVEGGGNHFVYLVDSSGSMGDAFQSARAALLQSVDLLTPKQRFYVVFFDAECDYMRISDPTEDEARSVHATPENKRRLKSWAMKISMDRGRAPYEPLEFALELRPDVIFLLSDGEFPQGIEELLAEQNKVNNLFGDEHPISIVHTIGYHSREGEERMRRIAAANQGQYRHIPKP